MFVTPTSAVKARYMFECSSNRLSVMKHLSRLTVGCPAEVVCAFPSSTAEQLPRDGSFTSIASIARKLQRWKGTPPELSELSEGPVCLAEQERCGLPTVDYSSTSFVATCLHF